MLDEVLNNVFSVKLAGGWLGRTVGTGERGMGRMIGNQTYKSHTNAASLAMAQ